MGEDEVCRGHDLREARFTIHHDVEEEEVKIPSIRPFIKKGSFPRPRHGRFEHVERNKTNSTTTTAEVNATAKRRLCWVNRGSKSNKMTHDRGQNATASTPNEPINGRIHFSSNRHKTNHQTVT